MLRNLRAEMSRNEITIEQISTHLGVRYMTVCDKINGKYEFRISEALKIRQKFFPNCTIEYLFDRGDHVISA